MSVLAVSVDVYIHLFPDDEGRAERLDAGFLATQQATSNVVSLRTAHDARNALWTCPRRRADLYGLTARHN